MTFTLLQMCKAQHEKFEKLSAEVVHMSMVLGDDSEDGLAEWRDLESSLTDERLQKFKGKKTELNKATVSYWYHSLFSHVLVCAQDNTKQTPSRYVLSTNPLHPTTAVSKRPCGAPI